MKRKKWTEKQLKEKIKEIEGQINYQKRMIERAENEIRDLEILLKHFKAELSKKYNNPSSIQFGEGKTDVR